MSVGRSRVIPRAAQFTYQPWAKICVNRPDGNSDCFTSSGAKGACQPSGGGIAVLDPRRQTAKPVDQSGDQAHARWHACGPDRSGRARFRFPIRTAANWAAAASFDIDTGFIEGLKHARTVSVEAMTRDRQPVSLPFPLAGFAEAFDGPAGGPPKAPEVKGDELQERAEACRRRPPPC